MLVSEPVSGAGMPLVYPGPPTMPIGVDFSFLCSMLVSKQSGGQLM